MSARVIITASFIIGIGIALSGYLLSEKKPSSFDECVLEYGRGVDSMAARIDVELKCRRLFSK